MNQRDVTRIARALGATHQRAFHAQSAASAWYFCIEAVADAIAEGSVPNGFDRAGFLAECRAAPAPEVVS